MDPSTQMKGINHHILMILDLLFVMVHTTAIISTFVIVNTRHAVTEDLMVRH